MIIQNAVKITEDKKITFLVSSNRHDFNTYTFKDGRWYAVDGGNDYCRRAHNLTSTSGEGYAVENYSLGDDMPFSKIKKMLLWGNRGIQGDKPLEYKPLAKCSSRHLKAILKTQPQVIPGTIVEKVIRSILKSRKSQSQKKKLLSHFKVHFDKCKK